MRFLSWLFKDSESTEQAKPVNSIAYELRKAQAAAEDQAYREAQEWYSERKSLMLDYCINLCKQEASKRFSTTAVMFSSTHRGYDFTDDIAKELRKKGLSVEVKATGYLVVSWNTSA